MSALKYSLFSVLSRDRSEAAEIAFAKPKHDYLFQKEEILSDVLAIWSFDMYSIQIEDLEMISSPFKFVINRTGLCVINVILSRRQSAWVWFVVGCNF